MPGPSPISTDQERSALFVRLLDEFARARGRTNSAFGGVLSEMEFSSLELVVLISIVHAETPPTVPQIGRSLGHARQVIRRATNTLIDKGLIKAIENPDHKRALKLVPTDEARRAKERLDNSSLQVIAELTEGIDQEILAATVNGLQHIRERLEANLRTKART